MHFSHFKKARDFISKLRAANLFLQISSMSFSVVVCQLLMKCGNLLFKCTRWDFECCDICAC